MIKVCIKKNDGVIKEVSIKGHAEYDEYGKDIVCASVSALVITSINNIIALDENLIEYENNTDGVFIKVIKSNNITESILNNMLNSFVSLAEEYPKNVKVTM